jgi:DNA-binding MurR/RpiR family transcriptional regulator
MSPRLTGKLKDIADYILANPGELVRRKVRGIAEECGCDDAMVIRFCKKLGYSGFSELKMSLAAEFMPVRIESAGKELSPGDSFSEIKQSFLENNIRTARDSIGMLERGSVEKAAGILAGASKIYLLGAGASGTAASDAHIKLMRMGFSAVFNQDTEFSKMLARLCGKDDAVLALSFSGETESVVSAAEAARERGARVVSVTNYPESKLARISDVTLLTASDEKIFRLGAMTSRIAQLLVLDFLIINIALQNMERCGESILLTHQGISRGKK